MACSPIETIFWVIRSLNTFWKGLKEYRVCSLTTWIKLEIIAKDTRKITRYLEIFRNYTLLYNPWVKEEITSEIRKYFELNKNKLNILKCVECHKAMLKIKCEALHVYIRTNLQNKLSTKYLRKKYQFWTDYSGK